MSDLEPEPSLNRKAGYLVAVMLAPLFAVWLAWHGLGSIYPYDAYVTTGDRFCKAPGESAWTVTKRCYYGNHAPAFRPADGSVYRAESYHPAELPLSEFRARMYYFATVAFLVAILAFVLWYGSRLVHGLDPDVFALGRSLVLFAAATVFALSEAESPWLQNLHSKDLIRPFLKLMPAPFVKLPTEAGQLISTAWGTVEIVRTALHVFTAAAFMVCCVLAVACLIACPTGDKTRKISPAKVTDKVPAVAKSVSHLRQALYLMALMMGFSVLYMHAMLNWPISLFDPGYKGSEKGNELQDAKTLAETLILYWSVAYTAAIAIVYVPIAYVTSRRVEAIVEKVTAGMPHADALAWPARNGLAFSIATESKALVAVFAPIIAGIASSSVKNLIGG